MIPLIVFYVHIVGIAAGFTRRWQDDGLVEGFLSVFFMALIFFVGWSISSFLLKLVMTQEGLAPWMDRDAASLLFLTAGEAVFYYFYLRDERREMESRQEAATSVAENRTTGDEN